MHVMIDRSNEPANLEPRILEPLKLEPSRTWVEEVLPIVLPRAWYCCRSRIIRRVYEDNDFCSNQPTEDWIKSWECDVKTKHLIHLT